MSDIYINIVKGNISSQNKSVTGNISTNKSLSGQLKMPNFVETGNYNLLINRPRINDIELIGNKNSEELGLEPTIVDISEQDIDKLIYGG